jgi:hypothetical protein
MRRIKIVFTILIFINMVTGCSRDGSGSEPLRVVITDTSKIKIEESDALRFQIINNPTMVIDKVTGEVWRAFGPINGPYHFVRMCYKAPNGVDFMPNPYEYQFKTDLKKYSQECIPK